MKRYSLIGLIMLLYVGIVCAADTLTVTQAVQLARGLEAKQTSEVQYYVCGVICSNITITGSQATFDICDSTSSIRAYNLSAPEGLSFDERIFDDVDTVLLFGYLYNYVDWQGNSTPEVYPATIVKPQLDYVDFSQLQPGYYDDINGLQDSVLKDALQQIIKGGFRYTYGSGSANKTWAGFYYTDRDTADNSVLDMYSNNKRYFNPDQPYASVSGLQIEHSFPKSWWGGTQNDAYKDLHHLTPADGSANQSKSNCPPGLVGSSFKDYGGFRTGAAAAGLGYTDRVFEPADEYKGDFARMYFYVATAYGELTWTGSPATSCLDNGNWQEFQPWLRNLLIQWHRQDPVSDKEIRRTAEVARIQHNRNPFIDYPCLAEYIWGNKQGEEVDLGRLLFTASAEYQNTEDKSGCTCTQITTATEDTGIKKGNAPKTVFTNGSFRIVIGGTQYTITGQRVK
ncbi:MAG: endonuclease [Paludibacteraceae bacterium]|nr:endonuclease [Paludibacteraceae bacterium]